MNINRTALRWNGFGCEAHVSPSAAQDDVWVWLAGQMNMPALLATPARNLEDVTLPPPRISTDQIEGLTKILDPERVQSDAAARAFHARAKNYPGLLALRAGDLSPAPDVVTFPRSTEEVAAIISFAAENGFAVVPWGGGSLGADCPDKPTIVVEMSGLDRVLEIEGDVATFEAGVLGITLEKALQAKGRTLGHRPEAAAFSSLGGWIAQNAPGNAALRYGQPHDWLLGAQLATPRGILRTNDVAGLNNLLEGSAGQLGIITQASVKTRPLPEAQETRGFIFDDWASGQKIMRQALNDELPLSAITLSDRDETQFWQTFDKFTKRKQMRFLTLLRGMYRVDENAVFLSATFEGSKRIVGPAITHFESLAVRAGGKSARTESLLSNGAYGYLRDSFLDRGAAIERFAFTTSWAKLAELQAGLRAALTAAFEEAPPRPGARVRLLSTIAALPDGQIRLTATLVFPRLLGAEMEQWNKIQGAVDQIRRTEQTDGALASEIRKAIKSIVDPAEILPQ